MPDVKYLSLLIDGQAVDLPEDYQKMIVISYNTAEPDAWEQKQSALSESIQLPATHNNDRAFNTMHDVKIEDLTNGAIFGKLRDAQLLANGSVPILKGQFIIEQGSHTEIPEDYTGDMWGGNGDWVLLAQTVTLWDCVNPNSHTFDVSTVESSWSSNGHVEAHDFVYAPVRYRSPWGSNNSLSTVYPPLPTNGQQATIYDLRPSLFIYWILARFFRIFGYTLSSQFMDTNYFRRLVMPWTWGDFFDITGDMITQLGFKAAGLVCPFPDTSHYTDPAGTIYANGTTGVPGNPIQFFFDGALPPAPLKVPNTYGNNPGHDRYYVASYVYASGSRAGGHTFFKMPVDYAPNGYNNFGVANFQFLEAGTGGLYPGAFNYCFNPPPAISALIGGTVTVEFTLSLCCRVACTSDIHMWVYVVVVPLSGMPFETTFAIQNLSLSSSGSVGSLGVPTNFTFSVPGVHVGDQLYINLVYDTSGGGTVLINSSEWISQGTYSGTTVGSFLNWTFETSYLQMTGLSVDVGGTVNLQFYDAFRNYHMLDLLGGLIDAFDLEVRTDALNKVVTIEPMFGGQLPTGENYHGFYSTDSVLDYSDKQDLTKKSVVELWKDYSQQIDFTFKPDGSDGGQNIYAARYKGIYLHNKLNYKINDTNTENGIVAAVPGASRYMLPNRFQRGNTQKTNRFFSATMHYNETIWNYIGGVSPQLICIFPENVSDSSAGAITQAFEPKLAWYKGQTQAPAAVGGWYWAGDPNASLPTVDAYGNPIPTHTGADAISRYLPQMFAVNYNNTGADDPVLSYCDQNIGSTLRKGLMRQFFLPRLAIMRNGTLYKTWMRLNLNDITNWNHRECIFVGSTLFALVNIDNYQPLNDDSCQVTMWKVAPPQSVDLDNSFPSGTSILISPATLGQFDLKYAQLLLFQTDLPQV